MIDLWEMGFSEIGRDRQEGGANEEGKIIKEEGVNGEEDKEMSVVEVEAEGEVEATVNKETDLIGHSQNVHVSVGRS
jgi:hypothetical protein